MVWGGVALNFRDFCGIHLASEKMGSGNIGGQQCSAYTQCGKSGKERYSAVSRNGLGWRHPRLESLLNAQGISPTFKFLARLYLRR